jgi:hypothetical protein
VTEFDRVCVIKRPIDEVFGYLENMENLPRYDPDVDAAHKTSDGPVGLGTTGQTSGRFLGLRYMTYWEVFEYEPPRKLASKTVSGSSYLEVHHTIEKTEGGTRLATVVRWEIRGFFKIAKPVVVRVVKKHFEEGMATLKRLLQAEVQVRG